jgi:hypothetical protein
MEMPPAVSQRVRALVRDELAHRRISQRVAAERLTLNTGEPWSQSKVHKILTGQVVFSLDDAAAFARILDLSFTALVREPGREFHADMTPSELKLIEAVRDAPKMLPLLLDLIGEAERRKPGRLTIRERMRRKE